MVQGMVEGMVEDIAKVEFKAKIEGRNMFMILCCGSYHTRTTDINILNSIFKSYIWFSNCFFEWI